MYDGPRPLPSDPSNHNFARLLDEPQDEAKRGADAGYSNENRSNHGLDGALNG